MIKIGDYLEGDLRACVVEAIKTFEHPEELELLGSDLFWLGKGRGKKFLRHWYTVSCAWERISNATVVGDISIEAWRASKQEHFVPGVLKSNIGYLYISSIFGVRLLIAKDSEQGLALAKLFNPEDVADYLDLFILKYTSLQNLQQAALEQLLEAERRGARKKAKRIKLALKVTE